MKEFKFSVVMAAYNTEEFLGEAIESLLAQDLGFEENIQLILVDDGSTDGTGEICDDYGTKYPRNILVLHRENGGVASARNAGLAYASGDYVNFMDSDDKLSANAMGKVLDFFREHGEECDFVSIPVEFFDGQKGQHMLNGKFRRGIRVIDLTEEYDALQMHAASGFMTRKALSGIRFDPRLTFAEDAKVCLQVLMQKQKLGVVTEEKYLYRKRRGGEASALQTSGKVASWYLPTLRYFSRELLDQARERFGKIPRFVQFAVMYDLQWKLKQSMESVRKVLGGQEAEEFRSLCFSLLEDLEDEVILAQKQIFPSHKALAMRKKHHSPLQIIPQEGDAVLLCNGQELGTLSQCAAKWEFLRIEGDTLYLEGYTGFLGMEGLEEVRTLIGVNGAPPAPCEEDRGAIGRVEGAEALGELVFPAITFRYRLPGISNCQSLDICLYTAYQGKLVERKKVLLGLFFPVSGSFPHAYAKVGNWLAETRGNRLHLEKGGVLTFLQRELSLWKDFWRSGRRHPLDGMLYRGAYWLLRPFVSRPVWLLSDRINKADDNGEALFRYLKEGKKPERAYFILRKDSPDYPRLEKYGGVVVYRSWKHKLLHLLSENVISSAADAYVMNPFLSEDPYFWDILKQKRQVFLQHGIIMNDLSGWLGRYKKNLKIFLTSAPGERDFILGGKYFYGPEVVRMTGLPRYDLLEDRSGKQITLMPTWRSSLGDNRTYSLDGRKAYRPSFRESKYFLFYDRLLNHEELLKAARRLGYRLAFLPHPNIHPVLREFHQAEDVKFYPLETRYREVFAESSLVVTDYSSVAFDFAYLEKPILYCQFDREEFFRNHICNEGYFDYQRDGFGEVETDLEGIVSRIIEYMERGCEMKEKYRARVRRFFAYHDRKNCERVYEAIGGEG